MAVTIEKNIDMKSYNELVAIPVASGETIYKGTFAAVDKAGYLRNLSSTYAAQAKCIVFVADCSANTRPAATTAAGSISGSLENKSIAAGDKTVRLCYTKGMFKVTFTSITQADLFKTVYASDNFTVDEAQVSAARMGTLVTYLSATSGYVDLNKFYNADGTVFFKQPLAAATGGGGVFNILNPAGATIMIERLLLDITTAGAAVTIDAGVAATGTSNDTLIDGGALGAITVIDNISDKGTNGGIAKATSTQYITGTASSDPTTLVGTVGVYYRVWE